MKCLFTATIAFVLALPAAHAAAAIPLTQTWAQLKAAPVMDLDTEWGPMKVRVGIDQTRIVAGRTLTVFALVEGSQVKPYQNADYDKQLGPLLVDAVSLEAAKRAMDEVKMHMQEKESLGAKKPYQLYAMLIPILYCERYNVTIKLPKGPVLAELEVVGEAGWSHPWTRLRLPEDNEDEKEEQVVGEAHAKAVYADWEICYPRLDGTSALQSFTQAELNAVNGLLPRMDGLRRTLPLPDYAGAEAIKNDSEAPAKLIAQLGSPEFEERERSASLLHAALPNITRELKAARFSTVDPEARSRLESLLEAADAYTLKLRADKDTWQLEFSVPREFARYSSPQKILARWWINGKPVVKEAVENEEFSQLDNSSERVDTARAWTLHMDVDYAWLGAKAGDTVSVQILYAPCGIKQMAETLELQAVAIDCESSIQPLLSNISTFTYKKK